MLPTTAAQLAQAVGGTLYGNGELVVSAISTDSRTIAPGDWFVPLIGERFDGHDYIPMALDKGAAGCFCSRLPQGLREDKAVVLVEDTKRALGALASWYRGQFDLPIVQITGSVGKTTAKEMIAGVLSQRHRTLKTKGNLNGDIGGPLTLLTLDRDHRAAVIETGMDGFGQIRYLGAMIRPDVAVITNIGDAHMEQLGSREGILRAKSEMFEHLQPGGAAVLNGDDPLLRALTLACETIFCGMSEGCRVRVADVEDLGVEGVRCTVCTAKDGYPLFIPAPGVHMTYAAAMAVAIGERLGVDKEEICRGIAAYEPTGERMRIEHLPGGRLLLNDSYNASPQSVAAALHILAGTPGKRRIAMLGDMKELGSATAGGHEEIGRLVGELGIDVLLAVGPACREYMAPAARSAGCPVVKWYEKREDAYGDLVEVYAEGAALLLKASHFFGRFDLAADYLRGYPF